MYDNMSEVYGVVSVRLPMAEIQTVADLARARGDRRIAATLRDLLRLGLQAEAAKAMPAEVRK
jgi:hypothetical protein